MIHYTCDLCHRKLDPEEEVRYVVRMEVFPVVEPSDTGEGMDDRDPLLELHKTLETLAQQTDDEPVEDDLSCHTLQFDLCPQCRRQFARHPLGRDLRALLGVSTN